MSWLKKLLGIDDTPPPTKPEERKADPVRTPVPTLSTVELLSTALANAVEEMGVGNRYTHRLGYFEPHSLISNGELFEKEDIQLFRQPNDTIVVGFILRVKDEYQPSTFGNKDRLLIQPAQVRDIVERIMMVAALRLGTNYATQHSDDMLFGYVNTSDGLESVGWYHYAYAFGNFDNILNKGWGEAKVTPYGVNVFVDSQQQLQETYREWVRGYFRSELKDAVTRLIRQLHVIINQPENLKVGVDGYFDVMNSFDAVVHEVQFNGNTLRLHLVTQLLYMKPLSVLAAKIYTFENLIVEHHKLLMVELKTQLQEESGHWRTVVPGKVYIASDEDRVRGDNTSWSEMHLVSDMEDE